ncbi:MAG: ComEC/Rec2 family competence protein [Synergistaceae bacterium]|nr:ComEC/Rec2 family competence protein [Synergistaceae bacterium]
MESESKVCPLSLTPAFAVLLGICGALFADGAGCSFCVSLFSGVFVSAAWILCGSSRLLKNWLPLFALAIFFVLIFSALSFYRIHLKTEMPDTLNCSGVVRSVRPWGEKRCALLISTEYGKIAAYSAKEKAPETGSKVRIEAIVFDFRKAAKKGGFDEEKFWKSKGAAKKCTLLKLKTTGSPNIFYRMRNFLDRRIKEMLPEKCAQYVAAITLGERSRELSLLHANSGTSHLLAVSGFHVGILAGIGYFIFRRKKYRIFGISLLVWGYVLLSGCAPGALRAAFMLQFALLSLCVGAPVSSFNSVALAGIILLLINPFNYYDIGFRLSVLSALFITSCAGNFGFVSASLVSMLVWFVTAAQTAFSFKRVPAAGLFMNVIAVPVFALLFPVLAICSLPAVFGLPFGGKLAALCEYLLEGWEIFARIISDAVPWSFSHSLIMNAVSAFIFFFFAADVSGYGKNMRLFIACASAAILVFCQTAQ